MHGKLFTRFGRGLLLMLLVMVMPAPTGAATVDRPYEKLKAMATTASPASEESAREFLANLSPADVYQLGKEASQAGDRFVAYDVVGKIVAGRIEHGGMRVGDVLDRLGDSDAGPLYSASLMWALQSAVDAMNPGERSQVFDRLVSHIIRRADTGVDGRIAAIATCTAAARWRTEGTIAESAIADYSTRLMEIVGDDTDDPGVRRAAVKGIVDIDHREAVPLMLELLSDEHTVSSPALMRSLCVAMGELDVKQAVAPLTRLLDLTDDEYVFASAAVALGDLGGEASLLALVDNDDRFGGEYCGVAIRRFYRMVLEMLASEEETRQLYALRAARHFYREERVAEIKSTLMNQLFQDRSPAITKLTLQWLCQNVDRQEARFIVDTVPYHGTYSQEWSWLDGFAKARPLESHAVPDTVDESGPEASTAGHYFNGNKDHQEYGDPVYRDLDVALFHEYGHGGIFAGRDSGGQLRVYEAISSDPPAVKHAYLDDLKSIRTYWGAYGFWNFANNFTARRTVVSAAVDLAGRDIGYPEGVIPDDMITLKSSPGSVVDPGDISALRCDGLIEYCFEYHGIDVWGKNHSNYDVSQTDNVGEHNNFYDWPDLDPCTETSPIVQCSEDEKGQLCTYLGTRSFCRGAAITDVVYDYVYDNIDEEFDIDLYITASDESGIHYIAYADTFQLFPPKFPFIRSPRQPQHPNSPTYTAHFQFSSPTSTYVFYYATDNGAYTSGLEWSFLQMIVPQVTLDAPAGGESWPVGTKQTIAWTSQGDVGDIEIEYSTDGGAAWKRVTTSTTNDGAFEWIVPDDNSSNCLIRIADVDSFPADTLVTAFSITGGPDLTLSDPNGGEVIPADTAYTIRWTQQGAPPPGNVQIDYSIDEGETWYTIVSSTPNTLLYSWTVPDSTSTRCLVSVHRLSTTKWDASDDPFTITEAPWVTVESPNGGEDWLAGKTRDIVWKASSKLDSVRIEYSFTGGWAWVAVDSSTANNGLYRWVVPNTPSDSCLVRICDGYGGPCLGASADDSSDSLFTITQARMVQITNPGPGDILYPGLNYAIEWLSTGPIDNVVILFSDDGGTTWTVVDSAATNDGSYVWSVPDSISSNCAIRVIDFESINGDQSANFSIVTPGQAIPIADARGLVILALLLAAVGVLTIRRAVN